MRLLIVLDVHDKKHAAKRRLVTQDGSANTENMRLLVFLDVRDNQHAAKRRRVTQDGSTSRMFGM
jgi:hypothetical protein